MLNALVLVQTGVENFYKVKHLWNNSRLLDICTKGASNVECLGSTQNYG